MEPRASLRRAFAVFRARNREFLRDRMSVSWNLIFPVLIVLSFAFAFTQENLALFKVGVHGAAEAPEQARAFRDLKYIRFVPVADLQRALPQLERHQYDLLLDLPGGRYWVNEKSPQGYMLERILPPSAPGLTRQAVSGEGVRYVDWLIPGVLGMNVMFSSLFGVGYAIVRYRKNGVLKRLRATPLSAFEFLGAHVASRLWLIVLVTVGVYLGTDLLVGFQMNGSYWLLLLVLVLGALSMISLSLLVAARLANEETANGLLNLISWPMMLLSEVWFSLEGSPEAVRQAAQALPLTHLVGAARAVMIDGAGAAQIAPQLAMLVLTTALLLALAARWFRWD